MEKQELESIVMLFYKTMLDSGITAEQADVIIKSFAEAYATGIAPVAEAEAPVEEAPAIAEETAPIE